MKVSELVPHGPFVLVLVVVLVLDSVFDPTS
jgi:hypothetical protein